MITPVRKQLSLKTVIWLLVIPALLSAALVYYLWSLYPNTDHWISLFNDGFAYLKAHPALLVISLMTLPGIGFPISPLLILVGIVLGERYGLLNACLIGLSAQSFCSIWTYALASGPLRQGLLKTVLRERPIPTLTQRNAWRLGFIMRITPGIPYALQNIVLGVMKLPFRIYLVVSIPVQGIYAIGFIVTGGAIFKGRIGLAITAAAFLIVIILLARIYQSRKKSYVG